MMMKSNAYFCVFVFGLLLLTSAFATDTTPQDESKNAGKDLKEANNKEEANQYYGGRCRYGCCGGWGRFRCSRCCRPNETPTQTNAAESLEAEPNQQSGGGYGYGSGGNGGYNYGWGGNGGYGGGGWGGRGGGGNWGGGRGCRYGCCGGHNRYGGCNYCCHSAQEAIAYMETQAQP